MLLVVWAARLPPLCVVCAAFRFRCQSPPTRERRAADNRYRFRQLRFAAKSGARTPRFAAAQADR